MSVVKYPYFVYEDLEPVVVHLPTKSPQAADRASAKEVITSVIGGFYDEYGDGVADIGRGSLRFSGIVHGVDLADTISKSKAIRGCTGRCGKLYLSWADGTWESVTARVSERTVNHSANHLNHLQVTISFTIIDAWSPAVPPV